MDETATDRGSPKLMPGGRVLPILLTGLLLSQAAIAQQAAEASQLTLRRAVEIALEKNPERKAALADTKAASADVRFSRSALMPRLTFSEAATRGNDPVYVFGTRLRQQRFTATDFALNRLNTPLPIGNFATRVGGTWTLFDSFASWRQISRARLMDQAAGHQLARTEQEIEYRVIAAYYNVLLAGKQLELAEQAVQTAQSIADQSQSRFDAGLAVESDRLSARVRLASRQQELIRARNDLSLAQAELNTAMGVPIEPSFAPAEALTDRTLPSPNISDLEQSALQRRPDLKRIESEQAAQAQSVAIAKSSFGPRLNAFGNWELDNPTFVAGGGGNNWTAGVELQIDLFQGGAKRAQLSRERAISEKAEAMKQAFSDRVRLEVRRAWYDFDASRRQVEVAHAAIEQAQESLRIDRNRYDSGLTTITDLLGVEDAARATQVDYWQSVYRLQVSYAGLELASGTLGPQSPVVNP